MEWKNTTKTFQNLWSPIFWEQFISWPGKCLLCHMCCAPLGHFLFLQVSESNALQEASIQSASFPPPVSSTACQVSYSDRYTGLIVLFIYFCSLLLVSLLFCNKMFCQCANSLMNFSVQMRFSLYLHGDFSGSLLVAIEENGTTTSPLVWERDSQWTDDWEDVALQLSGLHHGYVKWKQINV